MFKLHKIPKCNPNTGVNFKWTVINTATNELIPILNNNSVLLISPFTLSVGSFAVSATVSYLLRIYIYCYFNLTVSYLYESNFFSEATTAIEVVHNYVEAKISGGSYRLISVVEPFTLDASSSIDNDYPNGRGPPLNFSWVCKMRNGSRCLYQNATVVHDMQSSSRITFNAFTFTSDVCILFRWAT